MYVGENISLISFLFFFLCDFVPEKAGCVFGNYKCVKIHLNVKIVGGGDF